MNDPPEDREHHWVVSDAESSPVDSNIEQREGSERDGKACEHDNNNNNSSSDSNNNNRSGSPEEARRLSESGINPEAKAEASLEDSTQQEQLPSQNDATAAGITSTVNLPPSQEEQRTPAGPPYQPFHPHVSHSFAAFPPPQLPSLPPLFFPPPTVLEGHPAVALAHYYESQMRDHAAAYANAAAGAAWAAFQVARAAHAATAGSPPPPPPPHSPMLFASTPPPPEWSYPPPPLGPAFAHPTCSTPMESGMRDQGFGRQGELWMATSAPYPQQTPLQTGNNSLRHYSRRKRTHSTRPAKDIATAKNTAATSSSSFSGKVRRRLRSDGDSSSSGSSLSFAHCPRTYNKKKKARSDESLLGKTGVSALYEWCSKRKRQPVFQRELSQGMSEFDISVALDNALDTCLGRGKGTTKNAAKQLAARRALQRLVPGVTFDESTGILVSLPDHDSPEDLAYLTRQLEIRHEDQDTVTPAVGSGALPQDSKKRPSSSPPKRTLDVYPNASTTSEDDDENTYYTTRGASVCSSLLYAIIQIDETIPEPPVYSYTVDPAWPVTSQNAQAQLRRKVTSLNQSSVIRVHRGSHTCTARLQQIQEDGTKKVLEATGTGGNKREARHVASARLLALLFPECPSMVEVKAAAEALREEYAASKARPLGHEKRPARRRLQNNDTPSQLAEIERDLTAVIDGDNVPLPSCLMDHLKKVVSEDASSQAYEPDIKARQGSRLRQIETQVDRGLQKLNDEHESLPEQLTEDDVGRTVLRRAGVEDLPRIRKLLRVDRGSDEDVSAQLWTTSSFVLVLCRAIAAFEDPPLGCAVLTLGFDMEKGKVLRVSQIGNEPHLPQERLIECLQTFAACVNAVLVVSKAEDHFETMSVAVVRSLLACRVAASPTPSPRLAAATATAAASSSSLRAWPLQSVKEEEESDGASSTERHLSKLSSKPSKRSRKK